MLNNIKTKTSSFIKFLNPDNFLKKLVYIFLTISILFMRFVEKDTVNVTGQYSEKQTNTIATYNINISKNDEKKDVVTKKITEGSEEVVEKILALGIDKSDIKTSNMNVYMSQMWQTDNTYKDVWYGNYTVDVTLRDTTLAGELSNVLFAIEDASVYGPNFVVDNKKLDKAKMLEMAIDDARTKAESIAKSSGKTLGKVVNVTEFGAVEPIYSMMDRGMGGGGGVPVFENGTSEVSVSVSVTFEMR